MVEQVLQWFENSGLFAVWISIMLNSLISVLGLIPSVFLTAANISFFGLEKGLVVSIVGEAFGAMLSFYLYRKGIHKIRTKVSINNRSINRLQQSKGLEAFLLIVALRVFPFMPSGLVTLASAGSKVGLLNFSIASTLGKIPALVIEALSIQQILESNWQVRVLLGVLSLIIIGLLIRKKRIGVLRKNA